MKTMMIMVWKTAISVLVKIEEEREEVDFSANLLSGSSGERDCQNKTSIVFAKLYK